MPSFDADSTAEDVLRGVDLKGLRVLITGVSSGLGVETARDLAKAEEACAGFKDKGPGTLRFVPMDLMNLASVRACADALLREGGKFDVVIGNAGIMAVPFERTVDGFESQFGTNHLGHFVFINRIRPLIGNGGRVVMLSSRGHRISDVDLDDPNFESGAYDPADAYGRSKTANILFVLEFDRRHRDSGIRATAVHPGGIRTGLGRTMTPEGRERLLAASAKMNGDAPPRPIKSIAQGAATTVWAAFVAPADEVAGKFCEDCHVASQEEVEGRGGVRGYAQDPERAKALWAKSEALVGEAF